MSVKPGGQFGVWRSSSAVDGEFAARIEELGFGSLWLGDAPADSGPLALELLGATRELVVATGILSIWRTDAAAAAETFRQIERAHPERFLLGIGPAHPESAGQAATKPYTGLVNYLDALDANHVPLDRVVLAALGPRILELARDRTAGAHPYLVTPAHTREARELLGAAPLLVPEQHVIVDENPESARATARTALELYFGFENYRRSWLRLGYTEADLADGGSDAFIDEVVAHGSAETIAAALRAQIEAGADHVVAQVIGETSNAEALEALARIAAALELDPR